MSNSERTLSAEELAELHWAHQHLEHASFAVRLGTVIGAPIEEGLKLLPKSWYARLDAVADLSIRRVLDIAIDSMGHIPPSQTHNRFHNLMAMATGAFGGFFGPVALLAELPVTTTLMLRSIADIAHSQGEDLSTVEARMACMQVFALGGRSKEDEAVDAGYYGLRMTLSLHFADFLDYGGNGSSVPGAINLVRAIAARFGVVISDKAAAQMVPIAGAISGAMLNLVFMHHFQDVARGHFIVRRLERKYGSEFIRDVYTGLHREETEQQREFSPLEGW